MRRFISVGVMLSLLVALKGQVIADHTIVDDYDKIPQNWIDSVKTKLVWVYGMSHGYGYFRGAEFLEDYDSRYSVNIWYHTAAPNESDSELRLGRPAFGSENFYTSDRGREGMKNSVLNQYNTGNPYDYIWFGWSYQGTWVNGLGGGIDPIYDVQWAGSSNDGPQGNLRWGLDAEDSVLTGNSVCMDTYLETMEEYIRYSEENGFGTVFFFSNGVVDLNEGTELAFQRELKNKHIRDYVLNSGNENIYFLDYADILVHNYSDEIYYVDWNDEGTIRPHQQIHPDNMMDYDENFNIVPIQADDIDDHIGDVGTMRIAKAMWWLLARAAGWDGTTGSDTEDPTVPEGLVLELMTIDSNTFSWTGSTDNVGVVRYNVYRNGSFIGISTSTSFTDINIEACVNYSYTISAEDAAGNVSEISAPLQIYNCPPDITPTLTLNPNVANGITSFNLIVRVTEINNVNSNGDIIIHIPKDNHWNLMGPFNQGLTELSGISLNNNDWSHSEDISNHIFTTNELILAGESSIFGFQISFDPNGSSGINPITAQLVSGGGGELHVSNNSDSEKLDYFQE